MKIAAEDLFAAGVRIIGILAIVNGLQVLIMTVPALVGLYRQSVPDWALNQQLITAVYPLAVLLIGFYLISGTKGLVKRLYPDGGAKAFDSARDVFRLAMKITGMALIVYALPDLLHILSSALYMGHYPRFGIDVSVQQQLVVEKSLATITTLLFGFYLLKSGRYFESLAFKAEDDEETNE